MSHNCAETDTQLAAVTAQLERLRFTLDVIGTVDLDTGMLNRNGIFESIQRGQRWLTRRGDIYGALYVWLPNIGISDPHDPEYVELMKHLAATIAAGVRDVDEVGRADDNGFCAVLANLEAGALSVVSERVRTLLDKLVSSSPATGGVFHIGGVEVLSASHTYGTVLDAAHRLAQGATANQSSLSTI